MKVFTLFFTLFFSLISLANTNEELTVQLDGLVIEVVDFAEGDKLKLFEAETGDHILSKSYSNVDLSQLPIGSYVLENTLGQTININRLEDTLIIEGAIVVEATEEDIIVDDIMVEDAEMITEDTIETNDVLDFERDTRKNVLAIEREGDVIHVLNFEEGDKIKLFEVIDDVHVLTKTSNIIDLGLLSVGSYLIENNKGESIVVEKFIDAQTTVTDF